MAKELILYSSINRYSAETAVEQLNQIGENEDFIVRMNTPGGEVTAGWSFISKLSEMNGEKTVIIDGQAASMGAISLMYFDSVIANDTSEIMFHKAAYPSWYEPTDEEIELLDKVNNQFKEKLSKKVKGKPGAEKFLSEVFEDEKRNNVHLTMEKAKKLGIVDKIRKLDPKAYSGIQLVALMEDDSFYTKPEIEQKHTKINTDMTLEELKAKHPELYAQIFNLGVNEGVKKEKDRVEAWAVFAEINPKAVKEGIEKGENISQKAMAEFALQGQKQARIKDHDNDNPDDTDTGKKKKTAEELKAEADKKAMDEEFEKHHPSKTEK